MRAGTLPKLQTNNKTFLGRYWTEFNVLSRYHASHKDLRILSFGCATGEELMTLQALFPGATFFGCDTDWSSLQAARALTGRTATVFVSNEQDILRHGPFDIILCNSVLLSHTVVRDGQKSGVDPALWHDIVSLLDAALVPGGVLQIINSNIPFRYHSLAAGYEPLDSPLILCPNFVDQFDPDGRHLCSGVGGVGWSAIVGRHLGEASWDRMQPGDLKLVHFRKPGGTDPLIVVPDEVMPNLARPRSWASGTTTYRPEIPQDLRPSTHIEIDTSWHTYGVDALRVERTARRIWFDGSTAYSDTTVVEMEAAETASALEILTGRRPSRLAIDMFTRATPIRPAWL